MEYFFSTAQKDLIFSSFVLHETGITPLGTPTFTEWKEVGKFIRKAETAVHFWIGDWLNYGEQRWGEMYAVAMEETGFEYETLKKDKWIANRIESGLRSPNLTPTHAREIAPLPLEDRIYWAERLKRAPLPVRDLKYQIKARQKNQLPTPAIPDGIYHVLYVDPPWDVETQVLHEWSSTFQYPTMTQEELKAMRLPKMADDCVLFLWTTLSTLPQALELMRFWGFRYHITITWDKGSGWCTSGFHRKSELVLVGYIGALANVIRQEGEYIPTVFYEAKTTHSTKPQKMYALIEEHTGGNKIELFARNRREGWTSWGNQLPSETACRLL